MRTPDEIQRAAELVTRLWEHQTAADPNQQTTATKMASAWVAAFCWILDTGDPLQLESALQEVLERAKRLTMG